MSKNIRDTIGKIVNCTDKKKWNTVFLVVSRKQDQKQQDWDQNLACIKPLEESLSAFGD